MKKNTTKRVGALLLTALMLLAACPLTGLAAAEPVVTEAPVVTETDVTTDAPVDTPESAVTETDETAAGPVTTNAPVVTEEPVVTETDVTTEAPTATAEPAVTGAPEEPVATQTAVATEGPAATEEPVVSEEPATTAEPTDTEEPVATEEPAVTEEPAETPEIMTAEAELPITVRIDGNDTDYASFDEAWAAAVAAGQAEMFLDEDVTISGEMAVTAGQDIAVMGNRGVVNLAAAAGVRVESGGKLMLEDVNVNGPVTVNGGELTVFGDITGDIAVNGGTLSRSFGYRTINGNISVNGGRMELGNDDVVYGSVTVNGGTFVIGNEAKVGSEGDAVTLYSGTVEIGGDDARVASAGGAGVKILGEGPCELKAGYAKITGGQYGIYAVSNGGAVTITLDDSRPRSDNVGLYAGAGVTVNASDISVKGDDDEAVTGMILDGAAANVSHDSVFSGGTGVLLKGGASITLADTTIEGTAGPGLLLEGNSTAKINSGCAFSGIPNAIECKNSQTVSELLGEGLAYFDENDDQIEMADQTVLTGPVLVHGTDPVVNFVLGAQNRDYSSFEAAWAAANAAGEPVTLTLLRDVTVVSELWLNGGGSITFAGGDNTLTLEDDIILGPEDEDNLEYTSDTLIVQSGTIDGRVIVGGGNLIVNGGTVTSTDHTVRIDYGHVTVNSGTVSTTRTDGQGVAIGVHENGGVLEVNGGTISAGGYGISNIGGAVTINGGDITGAVRGLCTMGEETFITGGAITGGEGVVVTGFSDAPSSIIITGGSIRGEKYGVYAGRSEIEISGGSITGTAGPGLALAEDCYVSLSGGAYSGMPNGIECLEVDLFGEPIEQDLGVGYLLAEGCGYFGADDAAVAVEYSQKQLAGTVTVGPAVAEVYADEAGTYSWYTSIDEAWEAANAAGEATVYLLRDAEAKSEDGLLIVEDGARITLSADDHTLASNIIVGLTSPLPYGSYTDDELILEDGTINGMIMVQGGSLTVGSGAYIEDDQVAVVCYFGNVTVEEDAYLSGGIAGIVTADNYESSDGGTLLGRVTVKDAIVSGEEYGIDILGGEVSVSGGVVNGGEAGIFINDGSLTVEGGDISGAAGIQVEEPYEGFPVNVAISGGYIEGTAGPGLQVDELSEASSVVLTGGTFSGATYAIESENLPAVGMLAEGCGYFDSADVLLAPGADQLALAGPVTVHALAQTPTVTPEPTSTATPKPTTTATPAPTATAPAATATPAPTATGPAAPRTGDETPIMTWTLVMLGCGAALAAIAVLRRRGERRGNK